MRSAHRWLGFLIGVQVLLWVIGGLIMSSLKLHEVRGQHLAAPEVPVQLQAQELGLPLKQLLAQLEAPVSQVTLTEFLTRPVYQVTTDSGVQMIDAGTGAALSPISQEQALLVAKADYSGDSPLADVRWVTEPGSEYRGRDLPLWRVGINDDLNTALYIDPDTGAVVARRNRLWRIFDFVWMLHIMDYQEREEINHPLLIIAAATALLFSISGAYLLIASLQRRRAR